MKKGLNFQVLLVLLSFFVAGLVLAGCAMGTSQAPSTEKQAKQESPASPDASAKAVKENQPSSVAPVNKNAPKKGGTLTIGVVKEITTMNPQVNIMSIDQSVRQLMYEPLLSSDKNTNIKPGLAERWDISPDGKVYTFYLRKNVKFHNGKPLTASDIKWTVEYVQDPKNAAYGRMAFEQVKSVEATDDYTVRFTLETPAASFLSLLSSLQTMCVVPEGSLSTGVEKPASFPPGTGPFKFEEYKPGQYLTVARFGDYWGQVPYLDRVIIRMPIPDENVRFAALRAGDLDFIQETPFQWVKKIQSGEIKGITYTQSAGGVFRKMIFNVQKSPFDNVKVRQAFTYALDKQQLLDSEFWGFGTPVNEKMPVLSSWRLEVPDIKRDVNKARELLKEAGYPDGVEVTLLTRQGDEVISQVVQQQLGEAGIKVKIEIVESSIEPVRRRNGDFQFAVSRTAMKPDPYVATQKDFATESGDKRAANWSGYSDPGMDNLLIKLGIESDFNKRKELYRQVMEKFWHDAPEFYIGTAPSIWSMKDKVKGFEGNDFTEVTVYVGGGLNHTWIDE